MSLRSFDTLESDIKCYVTPYIGQCAVGQINTDDIQRMVNELLEKGFSKSVIKRAYSAVNSCLKHALSLRHINWNPCLGVVLPTEKRHEGLKPRDIYVLPDDKIKDYIAEATRTHPNGTPVYRMGWGLVLIMVTGLRRGEAIALKWSDIDFQNNVMSISRNYITVKNRGLEEKKYIRMEQNSTKSKSGERTIPLNKNALEALSHLKTLNKNFEYVFSTRKGTVQGERALSRTHECICSQIGIKCGIHSLRHTFASMLFKKGVEVKTVQTILGHKDVSTTYQIYLHIFPDQKEDALKTIELDIL